MKKACFIIVALFGLLSVYSQNKTEKGVSFIPVEKDKKIKVYIDGKFFTSYIYPQSIEKPVLYPITTSKGTVVTRGFPLEPRSGERVDHPHHVGVWFNYGDVNNLDFWNNSYAVPAEEKPKYGSILHNKVIKISGGADEGILTVRCDWVNNKKEVLLNEETSFIFSGDQSIRRIVRITKLTAVNDVKFADNKEGMFAMRVDRAFEQPSDKPEVFTDASGKATDVPVLNNEGVNGAYHSSEGKEKDAVWGTRAKWVSLSALKDNDSISICMFDHPGNFGFPGHWHARGYGLFGVNNIGSKVYNPSDPETQMFIKKGESVTFKHMLLIKENGFITDNQTNKEWAVFSKR